MRGLRLRFVNDIILRAAFLAGTWLPLALASACDSPADNLVPTSAGQVDGSASTQGGSGGAGGAAGSEGGGVAGAAGSSSLGCLAGDPANVPALPVPPGTGDLPAPSGTSANLRVLPWAGFSSAVSYTLDDTQPSQIDHWPELKAEGVRMTFNASPLQNWYAGFDATWTDAIAQGHEIGNHTMSHCHANLTGCNNNQPPIGTMDQEIDQCSTYITTRLGQSGVWTIAYPYGDVGYKPYAQGRFFLGRGVGSGMIAPGGNTDPFNLPVIAAAGGEAASVFNGRIDTARTQGQWLIFLFHSILPTSQNWYAGVEIASLTGSIEYAKGLGDVWIDSMVNVGAYWLGQRTFEATAPVTATGTTTWTWSLPTCFPPGHVLRVTVDGGTLSQGGQPLVWDGHGYYEVTLDAGTLIWAP
jgi:peptidoglycan/xylan/chitin deacetylase (PgdA/CDA1 family)